MAILIRIEVELITTSIKNKTNHNCREEISPQNFGRNSILETSISCRYIPVTQKPALRSK